MEIAHISGSGETASTLPNDEVLIRLEADFAYDGKFGHRTLEVTKEEVRVLEQGGAVSCVVPMSVIKSARNEPLVGGGRLEVTTKDGEVLPLISYSLTIAAKFSEAARGLEQLAKGEELLINMKEERVRCAKCNRLLPEKDGVCPACVHRGKTMLRISQFMKPYSKQTVGLALLSLGTTLLNLAPPLIQGSLVDNVLKNGTDLPLLYKLISIWLVVLIANSIIQVISGQMIAFLAGHIAADLRAAVYRAIEFLQLTFFDKKQVGAISSRVTSDTDRVWGFLVEGVPYLLLNGLTLAGVVGFLFWTNWVLAAAILAPVPVVIAIGAIFWKPMSQMFHRVSQKWARFHMHLNESLHGIRVVKAFAKEDTEYAKFQVRNSELRDAGVRVDSRWYAIFGAMTFFTALGNLILWSVGGTMVVRG
ncbi:MAG TPA: ABC transporter transmembrane domain-containing protein, partial [Fimbriimonas sp.]|nr:ABC transporter transmembrane domain-containing protein [Fimbriimonas sp.]